MGQDSFEYLVKLACEYLNKQNIHYVKEYISDAIDICAIVIPGKFLIVIYGDCGYIDEMLIYRCEQYNTITYLEEPSDKRDYEALFHVSAVNQSLISELFYKLEDSDLCYMSCEEVEDVNEFCLIQIQKINEILQSQVEDI